MIRANGGTCVGYKVDISKKEEVYKAADAIRRDVGDVSIFICLKWFCFFLLLCVRTQYGAIVEQSILFLSISLTINEFYFLIHTQWFSEACIVFISIESSMSETRYSCINSFQHTKSNKQKTTHTANFCLKDASGCVI